MRFIHLENGTKIYFHSNQITLLCGKLMLGAIWTLYACRDGTVAVKKKQIQHNSINFKNCLLS
jgi:hypothetical protein